MASSLSPAERTLRARLAAHTLHAKGGTTTTAARAAFASKFDREVDPDGLLDPAERARRADHALKGYMSRLALKSSRSRKTRKTTSVSETPEVVRSEVRDATADPTT